MQRQLPAQLRSEVQHATRSRATQLRVSLEKHLPIFPSVRSELLGRTNELVAVKEGARFCAGVMRRLVGEKKYLLLSDGVGCTSALATVGRNSCLYIVARPLIPSLIAMRLWINDAHSRFGS